MTSAWRTLTLSAAMILSFGAVAARAQDTQPPPMAPQFEPPPEPGSADAGHPVSISLNYDSDLNADVSGGRKQGIAYLGKISLIADADLDRLLGLKGWVAHVSALDIHGSGLTGHFVDNLAAVSGIEAEPAIRLNQLWLQVGRGGYAGPSLRFGKLPAQGFMSSATAALFVNSTFGWPASFANDLPDGGPSWPLSAPGAIITAPLGKSTLLKTAIFAGRPAGPGSGDPQRIEGHGFNAFRFAGQPFVIVQVDRKLGPATLSLGGWAHFDRFADLRKTFAAPTMTKRGNFAVFALADGVLWRSAKDRPRQLRGFARVSYSPSSTNVVDLYLDAGLTLAAPFRGRDGDTAGIAVAVARISPDLRGAAAEAVREGLDAAPLPGAEAIMEASYSLALTSKLSLQPNVQYIRHPAGNALAPTMPAARIPDAVVVGVRTSITL